MTSWGKDSSHAAGNLIDVLLELHCKSCVLHVSRAETLCCYLHPGNALVARHNDAMAHGMGARESEREASRAEGSHAYTDISEGASGAFLDSLC